MFIKIILSEFNTYPEKVRKVHMQFIQNMEDTLGSYLTKLQKEGKLRPIPLDSAARTFFRMLFSHFTLEVIIRDSSMSEKALRKTVGEVVDIFMFGIISQAENGKQQ